MAAAKPAIGKTSLSSKEKTNQLMDKYFFPATDEPTEAKKEVMEEKSPEVIQKPDEPEPIKEKKNPGKKGRKPAEKFKETLTVTIDKDIMEFIEELMEETREHKSMVVNKILFWYMKEYRKNNQ